MKSWWVAVVAVVGVGVFAPMANAQMVTEREEWAEPFGTWGLGASVGGALGVGAEELGASAAQGVVGLSGSTVLGARTPGLAVGFPPDSGLFFIRDPFFAAALELDASLVLSPPEASQEVALMQGRVGTEIAVGWVDGSYSEDYQRPVSFEDGYWRSEDGAIRRTLGVHMPGLLSSTWEDVNGSGSMNLGRVQFERRELWIGSGVQVLPEDHIGDDYQWTISGFEYETPWTEDMSGRIEIGVFDSERFVVPTGFVDANPLARIYDEGTVVAGRNRLDVVDVSLAADGISVTRLNFGFSSMMPAAVGVGEEHFQAAWAFGLGSGGGVPYVGGTAWNVEAGTFHRLDPTGTAVDAGHQVEVELAHGLAPGLVARGALVGINAQRVKVSEIADRSTLPMQEGDIIYMGRAEAELSYDLSDEFWVSLDGWAERSDRADVSVGARRRGIIPLQTVWGSSINLNVALGASSEYERVKMQ